MPRVILATVSLLLEIILFSADYCHAQGGGATESEAECTS